MSIYEKNQNILKSELSEDCLQVALFPHPRAAAMSDDGRSSGVRDGGCPFQEVPLDIFYIRAHAMDFKTKITLQY